MAGTQFAGFKNSDENMFQGKTFVLVPEDRNDMFFIDRVKQMIFPAGFAKLVISSAEQHDKVIAFTSQMAHVVSNAFIKSETAFDRGAGMSAGSYRDLTRVAGLDANMWTELFMENRDNLKHEIDTLINELKKYEKALEEEDEDTMRSLLAEGSRRKFEVESRCG
jgi:prephenate dehydrogenase